MNEQYSDDVPNRPYIKPEVVQEVFENDEKELLRSGSPLLGVDKTDDEKYRVRIPGLKNMQTGNYMGFSYLETDNYPEAQRLFIEHSELLESLGNKPLLELEANGAKISFTSLENFHPQTAVGKTAIEPHPIISELLKDDMEDTWKHTIEQDGWQDQMFSFVKNFMASNEHMSKVIELDQIKNLSNLSPKQAIDIATHLTVLLTKYHHGYEQERKTAADDSTAIQLLVDGINNSDNPDWQGNGVCRNFASVTKAVFESIKANQGGYSRLNNTYCVIRGGNAADYNPSSYNQNRVGGFDTGDGHAWNDFIQISSNGEKANVASIDVTWAEYDLDKQAVLGLDRTLKRLQMPVKKISEHLSDSEQSNTEIQKIISYYDLMIRNPKETPSGRVYYARQIMDMLKDKDIKAITNGDTAPLNSAAYVYLSGDVEMVSPQELTSLSAFYPNDKNYLKKMVDVYFDKNESRKLLFPFGSLLIFKDSIVQEIINNKLKELGQYDTLLRSNKDFRKRIDEI